MKFTLDIINYDHKRYNRMLDIEEAPITQLRMCVIKKVTFKGGHLILKEKFSLKKRISLPLEEILSFKRSSHFQKGGN